jgi:hypothetical protein
MAATVFDIPSLFREGYMTLNTRLHTLEATSFFMILRALKLVELRRWKLFGISLRRDLLQMS